MSTNKTELRKYMNLLEQLNESACECHTIDHPGADPHCPIHGTHKEYVRKDEIYISPTNAELVSGIANILKQGGRVNASDPAGISMAKLILTYMEKALDEMLSD